MQSLRVAGRLESIRLGAPRVLSSCVTPERASAVIVRTKTIAKKPNRRGDTVNGEVGRMREHLQGMSARIAPRKVARADTVPPLRCVRGTRGSDTTCAGSVRISGGQTLRSRSASKGDQNPCLRCGLVRGGIQSPSRCGASAVSRSRYFAPHNQRMPPSSTVTETKPNDQFRFEKPAMAPMRGGEATSPSK